MKRWLNGLTRRASKFLARRGPYRFALKKWSAIDDIDVAVKVLGTEFFRYQLEPTPLPFQDFRRFVVLAPHQDDETLGVGGTMALANSYGIKTTVIYTTEGEQFDGLTGQWITAETRDLEARRALRLVDAEMKKIGVSNTTPKPTKDNIQQLSSMLNEIRPDIIFVPWLLDAPSRHRLANHMLYWAAKSLTNFSPEIWGYQVHNSLYPNGIVDISSTIDLKREMLECFESQNQNYRRYDHLGICMAGWNSRYLTDAKHQTARFAELFFALPLSTHCELIEKFYFSDLKQTYRGDSPVIDGAEKLQAIMQSKS
jgi:N-acetylglucosamine malate deacetylase 1